MSEMVERVARAMCEAAGLDWDAQANFATSGSGDDNEQEYYLYLARIGISAMREPTEAMLAAAENGDFADYENDASGYFEDIWQAMIDEALK